MSLGEDHTKPDILHHFAGYKWYNLLPRDHSHEPRCLIWMESLIPSSAKAISKMSETAQVNQWMETEWRPTVRALYQLF